MVFVFRKIDVCFCYFFLYRSFFYIPRIGKAILWYLLCSVLFPVESGVSVCGES